MNDHSEQLRKALMALENPARTLQKYVSVFDSPGIREAQRIGNLISQNSELAKIGDSIARSGATFQKFYIESMIPWAEIGKLARPFGMDKAHGLTNLFGSQSVEIERLRKSIFNLGRPISGIEAMTGASRWHSDEVARTLSHLSFGHALKAFDWKDLRATIAAANEAMGHSEVQNAVETALEVPAADEADSVVAFNSFAQSLLQRLSPEVALPLIVTVLMAVLQPFWDYYVKEILLKPAATGDQRALSKEVDKLQVEPIYAATRRVVMKTMDVRMNPRTNSPIIGNVRMGELVEVVRVEKDWTQIVFRDSKGKEFSGWAYTRYLKALPPRKAPDPAEQERPSQSRQSSTSSPRARRRASLIAHSAITQ